MAVETHIYVQILHTDIKVHNISLIITKQAVLTVHACWGCSGSGLCLCHPYPVQPPPPFWRRTSEPWHWQWQWLLRLFPLITRRHIFTSIYARFLIGCCRCLIIFTDNYAWSRVRLISQNYFHSWLNHLGYLPQALLRSYKENTVKYWFK